MSTRSEEGQIDQEHGYEREHGRNSLTLDVTSTATITRLARHFGATLGLTEAPDPTVTNSTAAWRFELV